MAYDWKGLLTRWNHALLEDEAIVRNLPPEVVASGWLGYPGATEEQVTNLEARLGTTLPPSYREFLKVTNGWHTINDFIYRLWSTGEIDWFSARNQDWIDAWTGAWAVGSAPSVPDHEYFVYGGDQDCALLRPEYLRTALEISDTGDSAIWLLNPQVVTPDGEWEAWFFANWLPGATRHRTFWEMMQSEFENYLSMKE